MARKSEIAAFNCSVAQTLAVVGDAWTLMILRCAFNGVRTYQEFREHLDLSTSVLSEHLGRLTEAGVLARRPSARDGRSVEYRLTEKGLDLYPVMVALQGWGEKWAPHPAGPRLRLIEKATNAEIRGAAVLSASGAPLEAREVRVEIGAGADEHALPLVASGRARQAGGDDG